MNISIPVSFKNAVFGLIPALKTTRSVLYAFLFVVTFSTFPSPSIPVTITFVTTGIPASTSLFSAYSAISLSKPGANTCGAISSTNGRTPISFKFSAISRPM